MKTSTYPYAGYRFPSEIIAHTVWVNRRFTLSFRDVEDLLAERGITMTYETIRPWCLTFGPEFARTLRHRRGLLVIPGFWMRTSCAWAGNLAICGYCQVK